MDRRRFLHRIASGIAGAAAWSLGGTLTWAEFLAEIPSDYVDLADLDEAGLSAPIEFGTGRLNGQPDLAVDADGNVRAVAVALRERQEWLVTAALKDGVWGAETALSEGVSVLHPCIAALGGGAFAVAWAVASGGGWRLLYQRIDAAGAGKQEALAEATALWRPALARDSAGNLWIAWEERRGDRFAIVAMTAGPDGRWSLSRDISRTPAQDCCRPALAAGKDGQMWIVFDREDAPGSRNIYMVEARADTLGEPMAISNHPAANVAPAAACDAEGHVWIAWHCNAKGDDAWDIPRWFRLARWDGFELSEPVTPPPGLNMEKPGTDQSFEFPRVLCAPDGRVIVTGRPSHNFCMQVYHGGAWSPLYRFPREGWGGRGQHLRAVLGNDGDLWFIRRDLNANLVQRVTGLRSEARKSVTKRLSLPIARPQLSNRQSLAKRLDPLTEVAGSEEPLNIYFGDLHGHTWMSDGMGDVDEYFMIRRDYYGDDFASLTDHDSFVGKTIFPTEFEFQKELTQHFHRDGSFVTLFGQEYTTGRPPAGVGHKCVYSVDKGIPLFNHMEAQYNSGPKLMKALREWNAICAPHHTGWTGSDWENADPALQPFVEIVSNHGRFEFMGNRPIEHRGGMRGNFVQDALARGLRFGIVGGSDNHGLIWHHGVARQRDSYRTGLAAVLAPQLTRAAIFDALKRRRVYATTGIKARVDFRVNDCLMGGEIEVAQGPISIVANVSGPRRLRYLTVVKDNVDWYQFGGEGWGSRFTIADPVLPEKESFYYLRVEFEDQEMAWSSPVWVVRPQGTA